MTSIRRTPGWGRAATGTMLALAVATACSSSGDGSGGDNQGAGASTDLGGAGHEPPEEIGGAANPDGGRGGAPEASEAGAGGVQMGGRDGEAGSGGVKAEAGAGAGAGGDGDGDGVAGFAHRWVAYQPTIYAGGDQTDAKTYTQLQDLSDLSLAPLSPTACNAPDGHWIPISFSAKGDWFACGNTVFDARQKELGTPVALGCVPQWSPTSRNLAFCIAGTTGAFIDVSAPDQATSFDIPSNCGRSDWSHDGKLLVYSCWKGTDQGYDSYLVSPDWADQPLVPVKIATPPVDYLKFVANDVLAIRRSDYSWSLATLDGRALGPLVPLPSGTSSPPTCNSAAKLCLLGSPADADGVVSMSTGETLAGGNTSPSPDLTHFLTYQSVDGTSEVHETLQPDAPALATVAAFGVQWSSDGELFAYGSSPRIAWLAPTFHTVAIDAPPSKVIGIAPDKSYGVASLANGMRAFRIDAGLQELPLSLGSWSPQVFGAYPIPGTVTFSPSSRAVAIGKCLAAVDVNGEITDKGCSPLPSFAYSNSPGWSPYVGLPAFGWSTDSRTYVYMEYALPSEAAAGPLALGLVAMPVDDPSSAKHLAGGGVGAYVVYSTIADYRIQP